MTVGRQLTVSAGSPAVPQFIGNTATA